MTARPAADLLRNLLASLRATPAKRFRWLPLQSEYYRSTARYRLLRTGNQTVGKTTIGMHDLLEHAMGTHPTRQRWCNEPGEYWVLVDSWGQSIIIQNKLHALIPVKALHPDTVFDEDSGYRGKHPSVKVAHVAGGYSVIKFKTVNQRTKSLASATLKGLVCDEPFPNARVYQEAMKRVERNGWMSVLMTPINAPVRWYREIVEAEGSEWVQFSRPLTPAEFIPVGATTPIEVLVELTDAAGDRMPAWVPADADYIARLEGKAVAHEVGIVVHGEWDPRVTDRYYMHWTGQVGEPPGLDLWTGLGIDHGSQPGKQCGVLVQVRDRGPQAYPEVFVLAETVDEQGKGSPRAFADDLLAMLGRWNLRWTDLDSAMGDRALTYDMKAARVSNTAIMKHLRRRVNGKFHPPIRSAKKGSGRGRGSAQLRAKFLHYLMVEPNDADAASRNLLTVHSSCTKLLDALNTWDGTDRHPSKDILDALFYALDRWTFQRRKSRAVTMRRH